MEISENDLEKVEKSSHLSLRLKSAFPEKIVKKVGVSSSVRATALLLSNEKTPSHGRGLFSCRFDA